MSELVTVIILTYNKAHFISESIKSVFAQNYTNLEIIVIDDASTDNTKEFLALFLNNNQIRFVQNKKNIGISKSRNYGIFLAKGKFVAMLDGDDVWLDSDKLTKQVEYLDENPECGAVGTWVVQIDEHGGSVKKIAYEERDESLRKSILYRNSIAHSGVLFRKDVAQSVGGYDESLATMEDHDLWLRIGVRSTLANLPVYALGYRVYQGNITKSRKIRIALDELRVVWRHRREYQGIYFGIAKGILRLIKSILT
jgi:glycosyltransferase involved in cell wall biosynthesis